MKLTRRSALAVIASSCACGVARAQTSDPPFETLDIFLNDAEIMALPNSGTAWNYVVSMSGKDVSNPQVNNQNDNTDQYVLAKALRWRRGGRAERAFRMGVIEACKKAIGTELTGSDPRTLALGRNLAGYVLSADLVGYRDAAFLAWVARCVNETIDGRTLLSTAKDRPNNWGTMAMGSLAAVSQYLQDTALRDTVNRIFRGYCGDRTAYASFKFGDLSWQANPKAPVGINPKGATKTGTITITNADGTTTTKTVVCNIDGVLPDDQRRGGSFKAWDGVTTFPKKENYTYEARQGVLTCATILQRAGCTWNGEKPFEYCDHAILRSFRWSYEQARYQPDGDDKWQPFIVNKFDSDAATNPLKTATSTSVGKILSYADWWTKQAATPTP